jgi:hypothetical protein
VKALDTLASCQRKRDRNRQQHVKALDTLAVAERDILPSVG